MNIDEFDWHYAFTRRILAAVDAEIRAVADSWPDCLDEYEHQEELAGIAFVALQRYISGTLASFRRVFPTQTETDYELRGQDCPSVAGVTVVEGIWTAANYWKHHDEWPDWKAEARRKPTIHTLTKLGVTAGTELPCLSLLQMLAGDNPGALSRLLEISSSWRGAVLLRLHT